MSSYFDEMKKRASISAHPEQILEQVRKRYAAYLNWVESNALKCSLPKLEVIKQKFGLIRAMPTMLSGPGNLPSGAVEDIVRLHDLAHRLAQAQIELRRGRVARANPYYPGHREVDES